jgi:flavin reductase (DIM6/NTAB) family NADH-FMN oxidoreductase RutF
MTASTGEFTLRTPRTSPDPEIGRIWGTLSGRDIDKVKEANLTLEPPQTNHTPGIKEYPLTVECRVLYAQDQDLSKIPENIQNACYPSLVPGSTDPADRDFHTMYIAEIVDAYIIR